MPVQAVSARQPVAASTDLPFRAHVASRGKLFACAGIAGLVLAISGCGGCQHEQQPAAQAQPNEQENSNPADNTPADSESGQDAPQSGSNNDGSSNNGNDATPNGNDEVGGQGAGGGGNTPGGTVGMQRSGSPSPGGNPAPAQSPSQSPAEAAAQARTLRDRAQRAAAAGDHAAAFRAALEAWKGVAEHPGDAACAQLAKELQALLQTYGEAANGSASPDDGKLIRVR